MAQFQEVLDTGNALRDQIFALSQDGNFSAAESDGFSRLHAYYHMVLPRFFLSPVDGKAASAAYDTPVASNQAAKVKGALCQPGNQATIQAYYDAVFAAGSSIRDVTASIAKALKVAPG